MPKAANKHRPPGWELLERQRKAQADALRETAEHRRLYNTAAYQRFRQWLFREHPLCQDCKRMLSQHVHHVRKLALHPEDICSAEHTMALCESCHDIRTGRGE